MKLIDDIMCAKNLYRNTVIHSFSIHSNWILIQDEHKNAQECFGLKSLPDNHLNTVNSTAGSIPISVYLVLTEDSCIICNQGPFLFRPAAAI